MRIRPVGDRGLLLDCADADEALSWFAALDDRRTDVTLGARTVLLRGEPRDLRALVAGTTPAPLAASAPAAPVNVPVHYTGPDLQAVAQLTGLSVDEVVDAHTASTWRVAFAGFAPGFAYLSGGDSRLHVPRRPSPRPRVEAGSVGLAGEFSGIYPRASPGGWQLIGRTDMVLWDVDREPPALLRSGARVRFVAR